MHQKRKNDDQRRPAPVIALVGVVAFVVGVFLTGGEGVTALIGGVMFLVSVPCLLVGLRDSGAGD